MNNTYRVLLLLGLVSVAKAHHFIKLVILAGLGLAGLWMVHTLAQDFNKIGGGGGGGGGSGGGGKYLEKRSVVEPAQINWEFVLSRDPAKCARSFICQLAAEEDSGLLSETQRSILSLTRVSAQKDSWASKQLLEALKYGESVVNPGQCMKMYKLCPYSSHTMTNLLKLFGS